MSNEEKPSPFLRRFVTTTMRARSAKSHEILRNHTNEFSAYFVWLRGSCACLRFSWPLRGLIGALMNRLDSLFYAGQLRNDLAHDRSRFLNFIRLERNCANHGMAAADITLAN